MSMLGSFESRIAALVEGGFRRAFRAEIRPVELARRLAKEMDAHRTVSLQRVYVPNEYLVWLSPKDRERYRDVEESVIDELVAYLLEHARTEHLALVAQPVIEFRTDEQLSLGECAIEARTVSSPEQHAVVSSPQVAHGNTMIFSRAERLSAPLERSRAVPAPRAVVVLDGKRIPLSVHGAVLGRSRDCDVMLAAAEVSRRHAEIAADADGGWTIRDLGSTNGLRVNGRRVSGYESLRDGDLIELGDVPLRFEVEAR
jgi:hypothetical protein